MMIVLAAVGVAIVVIAGLLLLVVIIAFLISPERGRELMALLAMLAASIAKSVRRQPKKTHHRHRRHDDVQAHEHQRRSEPRKTLAMTIRQFVRHSDPERDRDARDK